VSALARAYAINGDEKVREKVLRLNRRYAKTITADFYENNRLPAYCYDKILCGLMDSHRLAEDPDAYRILEETTNTVALLSGPLVLFAIGENAPVATRAQLPAAAKSGKEHWEVKTAAGRMNMVPFTAIGDEPYSTYLNVT
jgi:hypothetical protein